MLRFREARRGLFFPNKLTYTPGSSIWPHASPEICKGWDGGGIAVVYGGIPWRM